MWLKKRFEKTEGTHTHTFSHAGKRTLFLDNNKGVEILGPLNETKFVRKNEIGIYMRIGG